VTQGSPPMRQFSQWQGQVSGKKITTSEEAANNPYRNTPRSPNHNWHWYYDTMRWARLPAVGTDEVNFIPIDLICPHPGTTPGLCGSVINMLRTARFAERQRAALGARLGALPIARVRFAELAADRSLTFKACTG
jgi:hypothetical protein